MLRSLLACLLLATPLASAQDRADCIGADDGIAEGSWKPNQPARDADWCSVDLDDLGVGQVRGVVKRQRTV